MELLVLRYWLTWRHVVSPCIQILSIRPTLVLHNPGFVLRTLSYIFVRIYHADKLPLVRVLWLCQRCHAQMQQLLRSDSWLLLPLIFIDLPKMQEVCPTCLSGLSMLYIRLHFFCATSLFWL